MRGRGTSVAVSLERLRGLGRRLGGEQPGAEPLEAIGRLRRAPPAGRRPRPPHGSRRRRRGRPRTADARSPRRSTTDAGSPRRATSWRSQASAIRYPVVERKVRCGAQHATSPGRSPVATSAHARPSSCSAGSNRNAGRRSISTTAAAAAAASPRQASSGGEDGQHEPARSDDVMRVTSGERFAEPAPGRLDLPTNKAHRPSWWLSHTRPSGGAVDGVAS